MNTPRENVLYEIATERMRQDALKKKGKFPHTCADQIPETERLAYLAEEFGEVAREVSEITIEERFKEVPTRESQADLISAVSRASKIEHHRKNLRKELLQVAAICLAWVEGLDSRNQDAVAELDEIDDECGAV